ncbi:RICIN domain-containing protein [Micromonospora echinofusca]|uniref:Ricin B lectin domain-containing protein n=1 Tax=Micromonospora echinofusca TaxID=47858 RepID=A0ABS3VSD0_MICEH|nr:RICIN domain-containing protein [Micromonospora echinofusca]MBO4207451.1 hypothetical protein [Micromonospora echinofusca]
MNRRQKLLAGTLTLLISATAALIGTTPAAAEWSEPVWTPTPDFLCAVYPNCEFVRASSSINDVYETPVVGVNCGVGSKSNYGVTHTFSKSASYSTSVNTSVGLSLISGLGFSGGYGYGWEVGKTYSTTYSNSITLPGQSKAWVEFRTQKANAEGWMYANTYWSEYFSGSAWKVNGNQLSGSFSLFTAPLTVTDKYNSCRLNWQLPYLSSFRSYLNTNMCLDVQNGNRQAGTGVWYWGCNGTAAQNWVYNFQTGAITIPHGYYNSNLCLDAEGGGTSPGTRVIVWDCHGGSNQKWAFLHSGWQLMNLKSGLCLTTAGNWEGAALTLQNCQYWSSNQGWRPKGT